MNTKASESGSAKELQFELKYCERCGGLWLRPTGGGQVYCARCASEMAELPSGSYERDDTKIPQGPRWGMGNGDADGYEDYAEWDDELDLDETGGVA
jgi:hypothetical protein